MNKIIFEMISSLLSHARISALSAQLTERADQGIQRAWKTKELCTGGQSAEQRVDTFLA
jgi:hypothetical protein